MDNGQNTQTQMNPELFRVLDKNLRRMFDKSCRIAREDEIFDEDAPQWARAAAETANALMNLHRNFKPEDAKP